MKIKISVAGALKMGLCFLLVFLTSIASYSQIELSFTTEPNSSCNGSECDYEGPGILINEIMMAPFAGDGSLWGGGADQRGEWIELYNPNFCEPVDISCYYLGNNASDIVDGFNLPFPGGYVIPPGTVVPPAGFVVIRGVNADPVPSAELLGNGGNTIELVVEDDDVCIGGGSRLWFPNAGGWFGFYDNNGVPQDAVTWANENNQGMYPCVPEFAECSYEGTLGNYLEFPDDRKNSILSVSAATYQGQSLRRIPDGGTWSGPADPTQGMCNDVCIDPGISTCSGSATVIATGGSGEYFYQWNDAQAQTTATATALCAQEYCVFVSDSEGNGTEACVTLQETAYDTILTDAFCDGEVYSLPDGNSVSEAGTHELMFETAGGCDSAVTINLEVYPTYAFEFNPQICENGWYLLPDGDSVNTAGTYNIDYQTQVGCDSIFTVNLSVDPIIDVATDVVLCEGETYSLPDGSVVDEPGDYLVQIPGMDCDTLFDISVNYNPVFFIEVEEEICRGELYTLPDGSEVNESGIYTNQLVSISGCDSIVETTLWVNELPEPELTFDDIFCYQPGTVEVEISPPGGTLTLGSSDVGGNANFLNALPPGDYMLQYSYTDVNGCSNNTSRMFSILPPLFPEFEFEVDCFNTVHFTNLTTANPQAYEWSWQIDDTLFSTAFEPQYAYSEFGQNEINLTVVDSGNCSYHFSQIVELTEGLNLQDFWLPNVITPNGDASNQQFLLMPEGENCLEYRISIFNRWGQQVYETSASGVPFTGKDDAGNDLDEGVYYYLLESSSIDCNDERFKHLCNGSVHVFR